jgi:hypothetical protein
LYFKQLGIICLNKVYLFRFLLIDLYLQKLIY